MFRIDVEEITYDNGLSLMFEEICFDQHFHHEMKIVTHYSKEEIDSRFFSTN